MPLRKEDAHHALELLEVYHAQLASSNDPQLRQSLERVINTLKSRLFDALLDIQEYYEVTIANETRAAQQKAAADMSAGRWLPNSGDISTLAQAHFGLMAPPGDVAALGGSVQYPYEEQGATVYDDWIFDEVRLVKPESGGYGFSIAGGRDAPHIGNDPSVFITKLTPGSPAANDGRLVIGAVVLSVNDVSFVNVTRTEAVTSLKQAGDRVHMVFKRLKYDPSTLMDIMLTKTSRGLGFSIAGGVGNEHVPGDPGLFITRLIDGGAAGVDGRLQVGDRIVQVNDIRFERITHEEAVQILKTTAQTVRIIAQKPVYQTNEFGVPLQPPLNDPAAYPYGQGYPPMGPPQPAYQPPPQPAYQPPPQPAYQPPPQPVYQPPPQPVKQPEPPAPTPAPAPAPAPAPEPAPAPRTKTKAKTAPPPPAPAPEPEPAPVVETRAPAPEQEALPPAAPAAKPKKKKRAEPAPPAAPAPEEPPAPAPIVVAAQPPTQAAPPPPPAAAEPSMPAPPPKPKKKPPPKAPPAQVQEEAPASAPPPAPKKREPTGPPVRKVTLRRGNGGLGFNIVGGEGTEDGIYISYVVPGGAADASGDIQRGDQILAVNGQDIRTATHEEAARALKGAGEQVELTLVYKPAEYTAFDAKLAEMHQEEAPAAPAPTVSASTSSTSASGGRQLVANPITPSNPSLKKTTLIVRALFDYDPSKDSGLPSKGLAFRFGDVLAVINSSDDDWWQAKRLRSNGADDSAPGIVPSKKRVEKKERARLRRVGWGGQPGDKKKDDDEEIPVASYLPVQLMEVNYTRPIVILGPFKDRLNDDLQNEDPNRFATFVPHTTREKRDQEVDGRDYYFVASREQMERDIEAGLFIEAGHYQGNLYGTSVKAVVDVALSGKHCILDVSGNALKRLEQNNLFPIAIFVKPKTIETISEINKRMNEDQCKKAYERAQKTESDFVQYFTAVVQGDSAHDYQTRTLEAIDTQNSKTIWAPIRDA